LTHRDYHSECSLRVHLRDEEATIRLGQALAPLVAPGMRIYLRGELGSGKTALVRALLKALGHQGRVKSPSYTLVEPYLVSSLYLYHFDFYRFRDAREWVEAGFRELFGGPAVCLVEWPERAGGLLPAPDVEIRLSLSGAGRDIDLQARTETGAKCVSALRLREDFFSARMSS
jgi:tRNA threonylcarbamoyladenosine biosynthesis protein TsaE